jgi:hypothetical protein
MGGKGMSDDNWRRFNTAILWLKYGKISREVFTKLWIDAQKRGGTDKRRFCHE